MGRALGRRVPAAFFVGAILLTLVPVGVVVTLVIEELDGSPLHAALSRRQRPEPVLTATIESIVEEETTMTISGRTSAAAVVFLLRDSLPIESGRSGPDGEFRFRLSLPQPAASFSVAAVPPDRVTTASFTPRPERRTVVPEGSIRSGQAKFVRNLVRGPAHRSEMVLSFDAGSSNQGAEEILDVLRVHGIRTTVFLTGAFIERYPDIARRVVADGHEVGNHTWSHPHLTTFARNGRHETLRTVSKERFQSELERTAAVFERVTGSRMSPYWRAPFGEENNEIRGWAAELGYLHVGWTRGPKYNLDSLDWVSDRRSPIYFDPEELAARIVRFDQANGTTLNGGIVLMHLGSDRAENERLDKALPAMIAGLQERGIRFVKVSELLAESGGAPAVVAAATGE